MSYDFLLVGKLLLSVKHKDTQWYGTEKKELFKLCDIVAHGHTYIHLHKE